MEDSKGKVSSTNDVYTLKISQKNFQWNKHNVSGDIPLPRCHHSACEIQKG